MGLIQLNLTIGQILERYPETREVFIHNGFPGFADDGAIRQLGPVLKLQTALRSKQIHPEAFVALLEDRIAETKKYRDLAPSVLQEGQPVNLLSLLPCPLKVPMQSELKAFLERLRREKGLELHYSIEAFFDSHVNYEDYLQHFESPEEIPDVIMTAGYSFFYYQFMDKFVKRGVFAGVLDRPVQHQLAAAGLIDPAGHFTVIAVNMLVIVADEERLGSLPVPKSWADLLKPEYKGKIVMRGHDGVFCDVVQLNYFKDYGEAGVERLGRNVHSGLHPAQMVKLLNSGREDAPPIYVMPYFFYKTMKERPGLRLIWPEEGALVYPVSVLVKADKIQKLQELVDYLTGPRIAGICAEAYFPALHPGAPLLIPEDVEFKWLGWDYIKHHDMEKLLIKVNELFMKAHGGGGGESCS